MRNFIVVVIGIIILSVFIGFNYIVWDREQVVSSSENKDTTIRTLSSQVAELNVKNENLNDRVGELSSELVNTSRELSITKKELETLRLELENNNNMITEFKRQIDINIFKEIIELWVMSIKEGRYEDAYGMQTDKCVLFKEKFEFDDFISVFRNSKASIQVTEIYFDDAFAKEPSYKIKVQFTYKINEELSEEDNITTENLRFDQIKSLKDNGKYIYKMFPNMQVIRNCTFEYDYYKEIWMISEFD